MIKQIEIRATLRRHNDDADVADDRLYAELANQIRQLAADPRYEDLMISVSDDIN